MSYETLTNDGEHATAPNILPANNFLHEVYVHEFTQLDLPRTYRMTDVYDEADLTLWASKPTIDQVQAAYIDQAAERATEQSWWTDAAKNLKSRGVSAEVADNLTVAAKHDVDIMVNGQPNRQGFTVVELGQETEDKETLDTIFETLKLADQFSGGLLAAHPDRPTIALTNGVTLTSPRGGESKGFAGERAVLLNLSAMKQWAEVNNTDYQDLVSEILTHELLGHGTEWLIEGDLGKYFSTHFEYSSARVPGVRVTDKHESITPIADVADSQPVREYGWTSAAEDWATSVEASVGSAMGWSRYAKDGVPEKIDPHRRDLVAAFMQRAARLALKYADTSGVVGSEVVQAAGRSGYEPTRQTRVRTNYGAEAVRDEIARMVDKQRPGNEFLVTEGDFV